MNSSTAPAPLPNIADGNVCSPASWAMACHCSAKHAPCYPCRCCTMVQGGGQAPPSHGMAHNLFGFCLLFLSYRGIFHHVRLLAHQQAAAWPDCSRLALFCQGAQPVLQTPVADVLPLKAAFFVCVFFFGWATEEMSTLRQMMEVPNEPGLCPNTGLENTS